MDVRARLQSVAPVTGRQFAAFRIALGTYLAIHFGSLIRWGPELFSREGALGNARLNPIYGLLPNVLARWDAPSFVTAFLLAMTALSVLFTVGVQRRLIAVVLWYGWACLFNRNVLIANAALPYVGFLLLLTAIVPAREPWRLTMRRRVDAHSDRFEMAAGVWLAAWALLATGYAFSGAVKLLTPSWIDGTAMWHVLHGPLVRPGWLRDIALGIPADVLAWATREVMALELLFLPLVLWRFTRPLIWLAMCIVQLGLLAVVGDADLALVMLLVHAFTFDAGWLARLRRAKRAESPVAKPSRPAIAA